MSIAEIIKAWKDEDFHNSLSPEQLQNMPENPTGLVDLEDWEDIFVSGGTAYTGVSLKSYGTKSAG